MGVYIQWNDNYSVEISKVDEQHRVLIELMNKLHEAMRQGKGRMIVNELVSELIKYTGTHFTTEEDLFERFQYPGAQQHKDIHKKFKDQVLNFQKDLEQGKLSLSIEIMDFLKNWLTGHILSTDKEYVPYLKAKGVE